MKYGDYGWVRRGECLLGGLLGESVVVMWRVEMEDMVKRRSGSNYGGCCVVSSGR